MNNTRSNTDAASPLPQVLDEAERLVDFIRKRGVNARLLGGAAIQLLAQRSENSPFCRIPRDLDLIAERGTRTRLTGVMQAAGYRSDDMFNALNGHRRLIYYDDAHTRQVDIFVGDFSMCHVIPVGDRLQLHPLTLSPADLLLTKIQIVELNPKDQVDILMLLSTFEVTSNDSGIDSAYIAKLLSRDWGFWRTATLNLERTRASVPSHAADSQTHDSLTARVTEILGAISREPRTLSWKVRARIGDRVKWYREPEEV